MQMKKRRRSSRRKGKEALDGGEQIKGSIAAWRGCFPRARGANERMYDRAGGALRRALVVECLLFVHCLGLRELNMTFCTDVVAAACKSAWHSHASTLMQPLRICGAFTRASHGGMRPACHQRRLPGAPAGIDTLETP